MTTAARALQERELASSDQVICTLFEKDYHLGLAALLNSLVKNGFSGLFWIGYRGELPPWIGQLERGEDGLYRVGQARLAFELQESNVHFTQYKPVFMRGLIARGVVRKHLWYFDPDITVRCEWGFFERWVRFGVGLCQEITVGLMPSNDPLRCEWMEHAREAGWGEPVRQQERYYNGGFVALSVENAVFLDVWAAANQIANANGVDTARLQHGTRANTFFSTDQDALNMASMYAPVPLSTLGPEGMGFHLGGFTMYHTVGGKKPWRKPFLLSALAGDPPWNGDKHFLASVDGPIRPFSDWELKRRRLMALLGTVIGRFYRRS